MARGSSLQRSRHGVKRIVLRASRANAIDHNARSTSDPLRPTIRDGQIAIERAAPSLVLLPAVSFPGGFRTPAAGVRGAAVIGRHPKSFTPADIRRATDQIQSHFSGEISARVSAREFLISVLVSAMTHAKASGISTRPSYIQVL
jgi:hypothetical protein